MPSGFFIILHLNYLHLEQLPPLQDLELQLFFQLSPYRLEPPLCNTGCIELPFMLVSFVFNEDWVGTKKGHMCNIEYHFMGKKNHFKLDIEGPYSVLLNISYFDINLINESQSMRRGKCLFLLKFCQCLLSREWNLKKSSFCLGC